jgi:periplasmic copper chaperone A
MRNTVPIMAALLALSACGQTGSPSNNVAGHHEGNATSTAPAGPVIRLPAVRGRPGSGYFDYRIEGDRGALVSVSSPQAGRIEMHETMTGAHNMSEMRPLARITVRDGETLSFTPGGRHLMVYDLAPSVAAGDRVELILHFERGEPVTIRATLQPVGGDI